VTFDATFVGSTKPGVQSLQAGCDARLKVTGSPPARGWPFRQGV